MSAPIPGTPRACLVCGTPAAPDDRFCGACGALLPDLPNAHPSANELDLERLFSHEGRIGRREYLLTAFVLSLFLIIALGLLAAMSGNVLGVVLGVVLSGTAAFALACATVKRLHDTNTTGWPAVIALIPLIGWAFVLALVLIGPTRGQNAYGIPHNGSLRPRPV